MPAFQREQSFSKEYLGVSISIEMARKVLEASKQRAHEFHSPVSIAIVDAGGHLVLFERMMAPYGFATGDISIAKAHTAVMFNQSTDEVAQWGATIPGFASSLASITHGQFIMAAGGWPLRVNGVTIGGIGVSGGNAPGRDDEIARAGLGALEALASAVQPTPAQPQVTYAQNAPTTQTYSQPLYAQPATYLQSNGNSGNSYSPAQATPSSENSSSYNRSQDRPAESNQVPSSEKDPYNSFRSNSANPPEVDHPGDQA